MSFNYFQCTRGSLWDRRACVCPQVEAVVPAVERGVLKCKERHSFEPESAETKQLFLCLSLYSQGDTVSVRAKRECGVWSALISRI